jgi:hypothetical protein
MIPKEPDRTIQKVVLLVHFPGTLIVPDSHHAYLRTGTLTPSMAIDPLPTTEQVWRAFSV